MKIFNFVRFVVLSALLLSGCGTKSYEPNQPTPKGLSLVWERQIGNYSALLRPAINGNVICAVNADGEAFFISVFSGANLLPPISLFKNGLITSATACDNEVVVAAREDGLLVVAQHDGEILWELETKTRITAPALVTNGYVLVQGHDGRLGAYSARLGNLLWRYVSPLKNLLRVPLDSSPIVRDDIVYAGIDNGVVVALQRETGRIVWHTRLAAARSAHSFANILDVTTPVVYKNLLCAASYQGHIGCVTRNEGDLIWRKPLSTTQRVTIDDKGERVFAVDEDGRVFAYSTKNGKLLWKSKKGAGVVATFADGVLFVGDEEGLFVFSPESGKQIDYKNMSGTVSFLNTLNSGVLGVTSSGGVFRAVFRADANSSL